ncbi:Phage P2 baseplate assembly protein gpV [Cohaesibacter marisflavi]|uniref:Phage P2 baseplate assembly protein gpV n=1 Tax=Cohaesibacter marisflavi TaxID=655353 RepID=A0A1I5HAT5_9HYPH|nr:phage baseplate assembly protein V [Cohaesibacter marisflavi]SFO45317.1 Phage P2 baseplate assembly protein gpV [Cohaesibacter marisflavi]
MDPFQEIFSRLSAIEKRVERVIRSGKITKVDGDFAEISVGPGDPIRARKKSFAAGAVKLNITASVGEPVTLFCLNGDARQAFFLPGDWTGENKNPSDGPDELRLTVGSTSLRIKDGQILAEVDGKLLELTGSGVRTVGNVDHDAGYVKNNGVRIDETHTHGGVVRGGSRTFDPK